MHTLERATPGVASRASSKVCAEIRRPDHQAVSAGLASSHGRVAAIRRFKEESKGQYGRATSCDRANAAIQDSSLSSDACGPWEFV